MMAASFVTPTRARFGRMAYLAGANFAAGASNDLVPIHWKSPNRSSLRFSNRTSPASKRCCSIKARSAASATSTRMKVCGARKFIRCASQPSFRPNESRKLRNALQEILREAIALRGSSISDFLDAEGQPGEYQRRHRAYGREAKPCYRCKTQIKRVIVAGRSSYFCPGCQPAPRSAKRRKRVTPRRRAAS